MELPLESYDFGAILSEVWPCPGAHCSAGCACKTMEPEGKENSLDADQHEPRQYGQWNRVKYRKNIIIVISNSGTLFLGRTRAGTPFPVRRGVTAVHCTDGVHLQTVERAYQMALRLWVRRAAKRKNNDLRCFWIRKCIGHARPCKVRWHNANEESERHALGSARAVMACMLHGFASVDQMNSTRHR
jgi:hypothetical protein